jgi:hypothetical protein
MLPLTVSVFVRPLNRSREPSATVLAGVLEDGHLDAVFVVGK